jgi:hypothetical protein
MKTFFLWIAKVLKKSVFWAKLFLGALFTKVIWTFLKSVWKDGFFDTPFDLNKEKKFSSLRRDNELFWELKKVKNGSNHSIFRKMVFYKQVLEPIRNGFDSCILRHSGSRGAADEAFFNKVLKFGLYISPLHNLYIALHLQGDSKYVHVQ